MMAEPTQRSWREIVEKADDKNRHYESLYPVVYVFSNGRTFRDSTLYKPAEE